MRSLLIQVVRMTTKFIGYLLLVLSLTFSVHSYASSLKKLNVTATAYNSVSAQTDSSPSIAAWGDRLKPGMKAIAVSRDLLKMGLKRGSKVKISGLPGEYVVLDKMHHRWSRKIDIYMGKNVRAAKNWGKRRVTITVIRA
jgi:3D (Asp-Asp-Asp) domain-containing protein